MCGDIVLVYIHVRKKAILILKGLLEFGALEAIGEQFSLPAL
jgi:hypothetical protein